jgi:acetyl esterase
VPIDPRIEALFTDVIAFEPIEGDDSAELRAHTHDIQDRLRPILMNPGPKLSHIFDNHVPVEHGGIRVRVYRPRDEEPLPVHVYLHGGGWWQGTVDHVDSQSRRLAEAADCVLVSVEYRLAPEHRFPVPLEDCYTALAWVAAQADRLGVDARRMSIGGSSAGANLAAAVTLLARERRGPALAAQVLEVPVVDLTMSHPSIAELSNNRTLSREDLVRAVDFYIGPDVDPAHPLVSPLHADLNDLPPALIMTAECDPLRDEGEAFGRKLQAAGVPTTVHRWPGVPHGWAAFDRVIPEIAEAHDREEAEFLMHAYDLALAESATPA